jgi:putative transposase
LGLQLHNKTPERRIKATLRPDRTTAIRPNDVWAMDFVHDQLATGHKLPILTVVDTYSRLSPAIDPRFSYRGEDMVATLEQACWKIGYPKTIRVDNGSGSESVHSTIHLPRHGSVGLPSRSDSGLLAPR